MGKKITKTLITVFDHKEYTYFENIELLYSLMVMQGGSEAKEEWGALLIKTKLYYSPLSS